MLKIISDGFGESFGVLVRNVLEFREVVRGVLTRAEGDCEGYWDIRLKCRRFGTHVIYLHRRINACAQSDWLRPEQCYRAVHCVAYCEVFLVTQRHALLEVEV